MFNVPPPFIDKYEIIFNILLLSRKLRFKMLQNDCDFKPDPVLYWRFLPFTFSSIFELITKYSV